LAKDGATVSGNKPYEDQSIHQVNYLSVEDLTPSGLHQVRRTSRGEKAIVFLGVLGLGKRITRRDGPDFPLGVGTKELQGQKIRKGNFLGRNKKRNGHSGRGSGLAVNAFKSSLKEKDSGVPPGQ